MEKIELLENVNFGKRVAEDEVNELKKYFVKTDMWRSMVKGEIDIVYGPKGSGKSAIYLLLNDYREELLKKNIVIEPAENITGSTVFKNMITNPPKSENTFIFTWKSYLVLVILKTLKEHNIQIDSLNNLYEKLEELNIIPKRVTLKNLFKAAQGIVSGFVNNSTNAFTFTTEIDSITGNISYSSKLDFDNAILDEKINQSSIDDIFELINDELENMNTSVWIMFDRLDVAFSENRDLEKNALRALFRVYNDLKLCTNISLKIFVRDDIWDRISEDGFAEASHITKALHITWNQESIRKLILSRLINSEYFNEYYNIEDKASIIDNLNKQIELFSRLFPEKIDSGKNPLTIEWIISRTQDSSKRPSPREIIHLMEVARVKELESYKKGEAKSNSTVLIDRKSFRSALEPVSKEKYQKTLLAEYPEYRKYIKKLEKKKAEFSISRLAVIWEINDEEAKSIANQLATIGLFEIKGDRNKQSKSAGGEMVTYWIPFIYRDALESTQGKSV